VVLLTVLLSAGEKGGADEGDMPAEAPEPRAIVPENSVAD
jgi:hypothetical protein